MDCRYVLLGSCFAQNIGARMQQEGLPVVCNPLGTLFNPKSVEQTIACSLKGSKWFQGVSDGLFFFDEAMKEWRCWLANTKFKAETKEECEELVNKELRNLGNALRAAERLFITFGTNVCYRLKELGLVVTNCQRQPDRLFDEVRMTQDEVETTIEEMLQLLQRECPQLKVTFTVSPYRYKKYGLHGSQLSKAVLLLAIDNIVKRHPHETDYFPSYEIMMDELRDFKWYAEDGVHPNEDAVDYIWKRLDL